MKVLIIGSGGREHAIAKKISQSSLKPQVFVAKGNAAIKNTVHIDEMDNESLIRYVKQENIDLTIVGPEMPLSNGIVNDFQNNNLLIFGPTKEAAIIETSKTFTKNLMKKYNIPSADYQIIDSYQSGIDYISQNSFPIVLKFDGLAAGKGVVIAKDFDEAKTFLNEVFVNLKYGTGTIIIEEYLEGPEFSLMALVNGNKIYPLEIAQDHKRAYDNDLGPNTGGMGAYSPVPFISKDDIKFSQDIIQKVADALVKEKRSFLGVLYGGLIKTKQGIKVIEFNARFGDPEIEVVLPRLKSDLLNIILKVIDGHEVKLKWDKKAVVGVVMAAKGYPNKYLKHHEIKNIPDDNVYHMGTKKIKDRIVNDGGRVLISIGKGYCFRSAQKKAYKNIKQIESNNLFYRNDIGNQMKKKIGGENESLN